MIIVNNLPDSCSFKIYSLLAEKSFGCVGKYLEDNAGAVNVQLSANNLNDIIDLLKKNIQIPAICIMIGKNGFVIKAVGDAGDLKAVFQMCSINIEEFVYHHI